HRLIGVAEDDLMADYLLTNRAARLEARTPELISQIARLTGREPSAEGVLSFLGVSPDYLREAFAELERRCGSVGTYVEAALGLEAQVPPQVAERRHACQRTPAAAGPAAGQAGQMPSIHAECGPPRPGVLIAMP